MKIKSEATDKLFEAILELKTVDDCYSFFEDLCTVKELRDLSLRLRVAKMLTDGMSYQEITAETGVSAATICRVNKCLMYGSGYKKILRIEEGEAE